MKVKLKRSEKEIVVQNRSIYLYYNKVSPPKEIDGSEIEENDSTYFLESGLMHYCQRIHRLTLESK